MESISNFIEGSVSEESLNKGQSMKLENVKYKIVKEFGRMPISSNWEVVVGLVQWGDKEPKYEIRKWKKDGIAGKGVTLTERQFLELISIMKDINEI